MNPDKYAKNTPQLLGAAFLAVIDAGIIAGIPLASIVGNSTGSSIAPSSIPDLLAKISENPALIHIAVLSGLLNSVTRPKQKKLLRLPV